MNYQAHYERLIEKARLRVRPSEYCERHHILPKCLGGGNKKDNMVYLTAREHYIAHQLLVKIYPDNYSLVYAAFCMRMSPTGGRLNNRIYSWLRKKAIACQSKLMKGVPKSLEHKLKITGKNNPMYGKKQSRSAIEALLTGAKKPKSNEHKSRIAFSNSGKIDITLASGRRTRINANDLPKFQEEGAVRGWTGIKRPDFKGENNPNYKGVK